MSETIQPPKTTTTNPRKRPHQKPQFKCLTYTTLTISSPPFSYIHLSLTSSQSTPLDELTTRTYLTSALTQFLGLSGSAISVDILKISEKGEVWVRVPREDAGVFVAAVGGWIGGRGEEKVGWTIKGRANWLSALGGEEGVWND